MLQRPGEHDRSHATFGPSGDSDGATTVTS